MVFSRSVTLDDDLFEYVRDLKQSGGNFSGLVSALLREYFTGGRSVSDTGVDFSIRQSLIERDLEQIAANLELVKKAVSDTKRDYESASAQARKEKKRDQIKIIERLGREFNDIPIRDGVLQYRSWFWRLKIEGSDPHRIIKNRIAAVSKAIESPYDDVFKLTEREYPGLIELLNMDPGVL